MTPNEMAKELQRTKKQLSDIIAIIRDYFDECEHDDACDWYRLRDKLDYFMDFYNLKLETFYSLVDKDGKQ